MTIDIIRFYYNGIREGETQDNGTWLGELQKCNYYISAESDEAIHVVARTFETFSEVIQKAFDVRTRRSAPRALVGRARIFVTSDHPLYEDVLEAAQAARAHYLYKANRIMTKATTKAARIRNKFEGYTE